MGTIATQLGVHPDRVRRALETERFARPAVVPPSLVDPYRAFLQATLQQYPRLRATRLFEKVRERGYPGSVVQVRRAVRTLRPAPVAEALTHCSQAEVLRLLKRYEEALVAATAAMEAAWPGGEQVG